MFNNAIESKLFADDLKLYSEADNLIIQHGFDDLVSSCNKWQLPLKKCFSKRVGRPNIIPDPKYSLGNCLLPNLTSAKDLGVTIYNKLHFNAHIFINIGRAHARVYLIHKCFISRNTQSLVRGFVTYVRLILEYASSTWSPSTITNNKKVESVQKRITKCLKGLHEVDYQNRLLALGLDSLELRRLRADPTLTYKILFGLIDVDPTQFFNIYNGPPRRGHILSITLQHKTA